VPTQSAAKVWDVNLDELIDQVNDEDIVQVRQRLEPWIPELRRHLPHLWTAVFDRCTTRFNKYLFLNAPELWSGMAGADWLSIMSAVSRTYRPSEVFDTGRFDDIRLLHKYVGVDSFQMFFKASTASLDDREAVTRHALGFTDFYLPGEADDELFDEQEVHASRTTLAAYRDALRHELAWLELAAGDAATVAARVRSYADALKHQ
jgi:hypothetical protein